MPQAAPIVINDNNGEAQTFEPANINRNGDAHFYNEVDGQPDLNDHLVLGASRTSQETVKSNFKLETIKSVISTDTGLAMPNGKAIVDTTMKIPKHFTTTDRARIFTLFTSALADALVIDVVRDGKAVY